jgi:hypothetical protein
MSRDLDNAAKVLGGCFGVLIAFTGAFLLVSVIATLPVYFIWNLVLIKVVGGLSQVTFIQAWAIAIFIGLFRGQTSISKSSD